jgi:hypothetical protein
LIAACERFCLPFRSEQSAILIRQNRQLPEINGVHLPLGPNAMTKQRHNNLWYVLRQIVKSGARILPTPNQASKSIGMTPVVPLLPPEAGD